MALVIRVPKSEIEKVQALNSHVTRLCQTVRQVGEDHVYIPESGQLVEIVKLFFQHNVHYTLETLQ